MKHKIVFLLFIIVFVSGCSFKQAVPDSWKDEILMAQECGMDGLMCCPDTEPSCQYGQECCVNPNDDTKN
jgi:hypothetical protein